MSSKVSSLATPSGTKPAGLNVEYNHDLDVSEAFLCAYPSIREALRGQRLLKEFIYFDQRAKTHKRSFHCLDLCHDSRIGDSRTQSRPCDDSEPTGYAFRPRHTISRS